MEGSDTGARQILQKALGELVDRENKLSKFADELTRTKTYRKALEKVLGVTAASSSRQASAVPAPQSGTSLVARAIGVISNSAGLVTPSQIALALDRVDQDNRYLFTRVDQAAADGRVVKVQDGYYAAPGA